MIEWQCRCPGVDGVRAFDCPFCWAQQCYEMAERLMLQSAEHQLKGIAADRLQMMVLYWRGRVADLTSRRSGPRDVAALFDTGSLPADVPAATAEVAT